MVNVVNKIVMTMTGRLIHAAAPVSGRRRHTTFAEHGPLEPRPKQAQPPPEGNAMRGSDTPGRAGGTLNTTTPTHSTTRSRPEGRDRTTSMLFSKILQSFGGSFDSEDLTKKASISQNRLRLHRKVGATAKTSLRASARHYGQIEGRTA